MCDQRERLMDYLYDEAAPTERKVVEAHLESCGDCRDEMRAFRRVREDLLAWDVPHYESVWTPFAPTAVAPWYRQVPAWAMSAAAGVMLLLGTAGGFAAQAVMANRMTAQTPQVTEVAQVETPAPAPLVVPASLAGLNEDEVRMLIQREIAGSGVMRVANTAPGLSPAVRLELLSETESLVYERHKELWTRVNQFATSVQTERAIEQREYQKEIGLLKTQVEELNRTVGHLIGQQNAKGQQQ
ncbi:MAG: zf-HC2 domain-containing protein [Acidobacteria bacterium]|nr:zf-HC2 domain-containing protein [Acidobacteriota bacterium]